MSKKTIRKPDYEKGGLAIAKAIHYANASAAQFRSAIAELQVIQDEKLFYERLAQRVEKVAEDFRLEIADPLVRRAMKTDLSDKYKIDAVAELFMQLNPVNWEKAENYMNELITKQNDQNQEIHQEA